MQWCQFSGVISFKRMAFMINAIVIKRLNNYDISQLMCMDLGNAAHNGIMLGKLATKCGPNPFVN